MNKKGLAALGILAVFFAALILIPSLSYSAVYKWTDKQGQIHITHYPPGADEIAEEAAEPPAEKPAKEIEVTGPALAPTPTPSTEEKAEVPMPAVPPQKAQPEPQAAKPSSPAGTDPQLPAMPLPFPKDMPGFPTDKMPGMPPGAIAAMISFIMSFFLIIAIVFYLFFSACLYSIAKKLNVPSPFLAWIPLVQVWTFVVAAKGTDESPVLWIIGMIVPIVSLVVTTYLWLCITENMEKNKWLGLLTLLPIVNLVFIAWLALQKGPSRPQQGESLAVGAG